MNGPAMEIESFSPSDNRTKDKTVKALINQIIQVFFLIFIPVLILLHTFMPKTGIILHRNIITEITKLANPRNQYNLTFVEGKFWKTNFTYPIRQIVPKKSWYQVTFFGNSLVRESYRYCKFHNAYFSLYGVTQGKYRFDFCNHYSGARWSLVENPRPWEYYDKVVLGFSFHHEFGHFLSDMLCGLIQIPEEDFKDAEIFIPFNLKVSKEYCKYMGLNPDKVHVLENYYTYANQITAYVTEEGVNAFWLKGFKMLKEKLHQNLNLTTIKPTRYVCLNRCPGLMRILNNYEEVIAFIKTKYPQYPWEIADPKIVFSLEENSKLMASTLYLITTGGSNNFNAIFMQTGTYVVIAGSNYVDYPNLAVYYSMDIWAIYANGELAHNWVDWWRTFPLNVLDEAMKIMFDVMKHGNWPDYAAKNYLYAWSYEDNIKRAKKNQNKRLKKDSDYDNRLIK